MLNVACVLKSGGEYNAQHVRWLRQQIEQHLSAPHRFVCLSDVDVPCERIPLEHGWPGWFSKIELFKPGLFDRPTVYLDLDTIVCGPIGDIAIGHQFTVLENFWRPDRIGSGLMAWDPVVDLSQIYEWFRRDPATAMRKYSVPARWGDQALIKDHTPVTPERWQHKYPGRVVSYKRTILRLHGGQVPRDASIICFHGAPRPWATDLGKEIYARL